MSAVFLKTILHRILVYSVPPFPVMMPRLCFTVTIGWLFWTSRHVLLRRIATTPLVFWSGGTTLRSSSLDLPINQLCMSVFLLSIQLRTALIAAFGSVRLQFFLITLSWCFVFVALSDIFFVVWCLLGPTFAPMRFLLPLGTSFCQCSTWLNTCSSGCRLSCPLLSKFAKLWNKFTSCKLFGNTSLTSLPHIWLWRLWR